MGLRDRLRMLEGGEDSCVVCGWGPRTTLHVEWDHNGEEGEEDEEPKYCPACGRPDSITVTWEDSDGA